MQLIEHISQIHQRFVSEFDQSLFVDFCVCARIAS